MKCLHSIRCVPCAAFRLPTLFAVFVFGLFSAKAEESSIVATVGDEVLTVYDLKMQTAYALTALRKQYSGNELQDHAKQVYRNAVETFVERELIYSEFKSLDTKLPADMIYSRVDRIVMSYTGGDVAKFEDLLAEKGVIYGGTSLGPGTTMEELEALVEKMLSIELMLRERVRRGIEISPVDVREYYETNHEMLSDKSGVRLQVIMLKPDGKYAGRVKETVAEILKKFDGGVPFENLAKEYSEGMNADGGGLQDWMTEPSEKLLPVVESLLVGEVYREPVELGGKTFVIRLAERREEGLRPLTEELQAQIEEHLQAQEETRRYQAFVSELRTKYPVKNFYAQ